MSMSYHYHAILVITMPRILFYFFHDNFLSKLHFLCDFIGFVNKYAFIPTDMSLYKCAKCLSMEEFGKKIIINVYEMPTMCVTST